VSIRAGAERVEQGRAWWLRLLLVAQAPRPVFAALRDDSRAAAEDRQEPLAMAVFAAGLALTLLSSQAASFADDPARRGIVIPVWLFVAGGLVAIVNYWLGGGLLYLALKWLGGGSSYRQARHLLGLAAVPLAFSLVLLPIRLALYGGDIFRSGGSDSGAGTYVFTGLAGAAGLWAFALLAIGISTLESWSWLRTAGGVLLFASLVAVVDLGLSLFG
jgi:hypothetical protein